MFTANYERTDTNILGYISVSTAHFEQAIESRRFVTDQSRFSRIVYKNEFVLLVEQTEPKRIGRDLTMVIDMIMDTTVFFRVIDEDLDAYWLNKIKEANNART